MGADLPPKRRRAGQPRGAGRRGRAPRRRFGRPGPGPPLRQGSRHGCRLERRGSKCACGHQLATLAASARRARAVARANLAPLVVGQRPDAT